ncbi:MAG TPA: DUF2946 family protein [Rhizomicrobium sp.]|jgi:hypothetical protein|nr:DUF2946 family protein [Rhizomicrobium sp.]
MTRNIRLAVVHLALVALLLRALLPTGWMPNPAGAAGAPFIICTLDGPALAVDGKGHKQTPDDPRSHESCPFAAAASLAPPVGFVRLVAPELTRSPAPRTLAAGLSARDGPFSRPAARAPPALA